MSKHIDNLNQVRAFVRTGAGQAANFTQLDWVRTQLLSESGIDPYPGTLNLKVESDEEQLNWARIKKRTDYLQMTPEGGFCAARLFPVRINGELPGAALIPEVDDYADDQIEVVASVSLREHMNLVDGVGAHLEVLQPRRYPVVLFDVDGTLLNSLDGYRVAVSRATAQYGWEVSDEIVRKALNGNHSFWDLLIPDPALRTDEFIQELRAEILKQWPAALEENVDVLPGIAEMLHQLKESGVRLGIFTGSGGESMPPLKKAGLLELFEVVITGNDVSERKPKPEGLQLCLQHLGVAADDAVYIGDSCVDVGASKASGMASISVLTGAGDPVSLALAGSERIISSAARLCDALKFDGP
ncbi:MAG: HAD-IA family hydrolase [Gammaproteobacteria bacterium]|nr:HAD-IA family hydrolase [Gammaproteobacteria bacterium]